MNFRSSASALGKASGLTQALQGLLRQVESQPYCSHQLVRLHCAVEPLDMLALLSTLHGIERQYFSLRDQSLSIAGIGQASRLSASNAAQLATVFEQAEKIVAQSDSLWIGGCSFSGASGSGHWQDFPAAMFVLPLLEIREQAGEQLVAINLYAESLAQWQGKLGELAAIGELIESQPRPQPEAQIIDRTEFSSRFHWSRLIGKALQSITKQDLEKVVLAREIQFGLTGEADVFQALGRMNRQDNPGYLFAIESGQSRFFGCSPERLFCKTGHKLSTEALAGTVRRGRNASEDKLLEARLINSSKLVREHRLVADAIQASIKPLASHVSARDEVSAVKLQHIQHSYQKISAVLLPGVSLAEVYHALHPTPAICGYPTPQANAFIRDHERFQRGWYSGAVGLIGSQGAELSVAIRSALSRGDQLWMYSGVGIVRGSNAENEWQELESKLQSLLQALGNTPSG